MIRRFKKRERKWSEFPDKNAFQLNDTHPTLAVIELLRILVDEEGLEHDFAWSLVYKSFAYTNHTLLPEALESWGVDMLGKLLPRHLEIIYHVNYLFLEKISHKYPYDNEKLSKLSCI